MILDTGSINWNLKISYDKIGLNRLVQKKTHTSQFFFEPDSRPPPQTNLNGAT